MNRGNYYSNLRVDLVNMIKAKEIKIALEIGGGDFETLRYITEKYNARGIGIDIRVPNDVKNIQFLRADLDNIESLIVNGQKYDLVIAGDVLEHTKNPKVICQKVFDSLNESGKFVLSVPNVRNIKAFFWIYIMGRFPRNDSGLFDKTHLSWFTYLEIKQMLETTGFHIESYKPLGRLKRLFLGRRSLFSEFTALQHGFVATKKVETIIN